VAERRLDRARTRDHGAHDEVSPNCEDLAALNWLQRERGDPPGGLGDLLDACEPPRANGSCSPAPWTARTLRALAKMSGARGNVEADVEAERGGEAPRSGADVEPGSLRSGDEGTQATDLVVEQDLPGVGVVPRVVARRELLEG
jgi:hypothetical protein